MSATPVGLPYPYLCRWTESGEAEQRAQVD
jgi:hypothetical protein